MVITNPAACRDDDFTHTLSVSCPILPQRRRVCFSICFTLLLSRLLCAGVDGTILEVNPAFAAMLGVSITPTPSPSSMPYA